MNPRYIVQTAGDEITCEEIGDGFDDLAEAIDVARANNAMVFDQETGSIDPATNFSGVSL